MDSSNGFSRTDGPPEGWAHRVSHARGMQWHQLHRAGDPRKPHLVLLHGTGADHQSWQAILPHWPRDWTLRVLDLPGHGASPAPLRGTPMGVQEVGGSLAELLLAEQSPPHETILIGHSAGAAVGLAAMRDQPWRLIGLAPSLIVPPVLFTLALGPFAAPLLLSKPSLRMLEAACRLPGVLETIIQSTGTELSSARKAAMADLLLAPGHLEGALRFMSDTALEALLRESRAAAARLDLLAAVDDPWIPYAQVQEAVRRFLPEARLHAWPGGGHLFHEQQPQASAAWIEKCVRQLLAD